MSTWQPYKPKAPYVPKTYTPWSGTGPKYYATKYYDQSDPSVSYDYNPRYSKLFKMAMSKGGFKFAQWYLIEIFERSKLAYYDVEEAVQDWVDLGRPEPDPMPTWE